MAKNKQTSKAAALWERPAEHGRLLSKVSPAIYSLQAAGYPTISTVYHSAGGPPSAPPPAALYCFLSAGDGQKPSKSLFSQTCEMNPLMNILEGIVQFVANYHTTGPALRGDME